MVGLLRVDIAFGLCHIDHFGEWCVKECCLNVHLVDLEVIGNHEGKKELEVIDAYDGDEGLVVIDVPGLGEALGDEVGLVLFDGAIGLDLQFENEHCFHDMHSWSSRYELPGVVVTEVLNLLVHGSLPVLSIHAQHGLTLVQWSEVAVGSEIDVVELVSFFIYWVDVVLDEPIKKMCHDESLVNEWLS
jgi:hypothetical protein